MIYDALWKLPGGGESATALLPAPEEIRRQYPNPCAWGVGVQDCVFNGVPLLLAALAADDHRLSLSVYRGLKRCAEVAGVPGFVARGVSPVDGKSHYFNSSRDTYTLFVYGMYRLYRHCLATAEMRREIIRMLVDVARYAEKCVVAENDYSLLQADGRTGIVGRLWSEDPESGLLRPHEALRLPMFYAAAFAVSGDRHWREAELRYADDAIRLSEGRLAEDMRASILDQMQVSIRLLWECETDAGRRQRYAQLLQANADFAEEKIVPRLRDKAERTGWAMKEAMEDWRKVPFQADSLIVGGRVYDVPEHPASTVEEPYVELAHVILVEARVPGRAVSAGTARLFAEAMDGIDCETVKCANAVNALLAGYALECLEKGKKR